MVFPPAHGKASPSLPRKEGEDSRQCLLRAALKLFAERGFAKTSTRDLAGAAGVNVASISYYFGDKAGLYRAAFREPQGAPTDAIERFSDPALPLPEALQAFYAGFLAPMRDGEVARQCLRLHVREMLEPTGLWDQEIQQEIKPMHDALVGLLVRHLGLPAPDPDVLRLAICLAGLGVHQHVGLDVAEQLAPGLYDPPDGLERWSRMLVQSGLAMIEAERRRRESPETTR